MRICFELFLSPYFLFCEILKLNLTFAVCRIPEALTLFIISRSWTGFQGKILEVRKSVKRIIITNFYPCFTRRPVLPAKCITFPA